MQLWAMLNHWPVLYQGADTPVINRCSFARERQDVITVVFERSEYHQNLIAQLSPDGKATVEGLRKWYRHRAYFEPGQVKLTRVPSKRQYK